MKDKKIKRINVRISLNDYLDLKRLYKQHTNKYKSFSAYIRYLLDLGSAKNLYDFYLKAIRKEVENERIKKH